MKDCKYCKEEIHIDAKTCKHCGRHQKGFLNILTYLSDTAIILTVGLFLISVLQYLDSRNERIEAKNALEIALTVKTEAQNLYFKVDSIKHDLDSIMVFANKTSLLSIQNSWIQASTPLMGVHPGWPSVKQFDKNTNTLIRLLIPDSVARKKWWKETSNLVRQR
jgi:hypothetical protein